MLPAKGQAVVQGEQQLFVFEFLGLLGKVRGQRFVTSPGLQWKLEELAQAEQSLQQAQARRDSASVDVERHNLVAPVDGIFDSRLFEPGERPPAGQPVAVMLGGSQPYARIYVPERLRAHVRPGTEARIAVDGIDASIEGRVRWVAHEAAFTPYFALTERDRGRLTYLAKVDIQAQRERLPDGVPVEVELLVPDRGQ